VAGLVDDGVILNAQEPASRVRTLAEVSRWFDGQFCRSEVRGLDRAALAKLAGAGVRYGVDEELSRYFG